MAERIIKAVFKAILVLAVLLSAHLVYRAYFGHFVIPRQTPAEGPAQLGPVGELPPRPGGGGFDWEPERPAKAARERTEERQPENIQRPIVTIPQRRRPVEVEDPFANYTGAVVSVWEKDRFGNETCPGGGALIHEAECFGHGWTVGEGPQFHFWIRRVPINSENCPKTTYVQRGVPYGEPLIGFIPGRFDLFVARHPLVDSHVEKWISQRTSPPAPFVAGVGRPSVPYAARGGCSWGPGVGVGYENKTRVGVGFGFGPGWSSPATWSP